MVGVVCVCVVGVWGASPRAQRPQGGVAAHGRGGCRPAGRAAGSGPGVWGARGRRGLGEELWPGLPPAARFPSEATAAARAPHPQLAVSPR